MGKRLVWSALTALTALGSAAAQPQASQPKRPPAQLIRGVIVDAETQLPVSGAAVALNALRTRSSPFAVTRTATTGVSGSFAISIAALQQTQYRLTATKEGYIPFEWGPLSLEFLVSNGVESPGLRLGLVRENRITGRVYDEELKLPVANVKVSWLLASFVNGRRTIAPSNNAATTDADGRFEITKLRPGDYYLEVQPSPGYLGRIRTAFSSDEMDKTDREYVRYGRTDLDLAVERPIRLKYGNSADAGDIPISRRSVYRLYGTLMSPECAQSDRATVTLSQVDAGLYITRAQAQVPCNIQYLITGVLPGRYELYAFFQGRRQDQRGVSKAQFEVIDRNLKTDLFLQRGPDVSGMIVAPSDSAKASLAGLKVSLSAIDGGPYAAYPAVTAEDEGVFKLANVEMRDQQVRLDGLQGPFFIRQMLYNGEPLPDHILRLNPGAILQSLEIVISDKPAAVGGRARNRNERVAQAVVVLVRWSPGRDAEFLFQHTTRTDGDGNFRLGGLPTGDYRLFAVPAAAATKLDDPSVFRWLVDGAMPLSLIEGGVQNVQVELSEP